MYFFFLEVGQNQRNNKFYNWTGERKKKKSHCVFSIMAQCCKRNGFDKTSQSLSLCSPVETFTLLGALITASVSTLWRGGLGWGGIVFSREKQEKRVSEKIECRGFWGKQPQFTRFCCISLSQAITICAPVLEKKVGFPHLGFIESLSFFIYLFIYFYKWFLRETEESCREPHNNTVACSLGGMPVSVWTITMMSLVKPFLFSRVPLCAAHLGRISAARTQDIRDFIPHHRTSSFLRETFFGNRVHDTSERDI